MTKVNINGQDHQVEIDHDGDLDTVVKAAQQLWQDTAQPLGRLGPASAGPSTDRRAGRVGFAWDLGATERPEVTG